MAEVLLSAEFDKTAFKSDVAITPAMYEKLHIIPFLRGKPEKLNQMHIQRTFNKQHELHKILKPFYYSCITCDVNYIYIHNKQTGLTDVYDILGNFKAAMAFRIEREFRGYRLVNSYDFRRWNKMLMTDKFIYATDYHLVYKMLKYSDLCMTNKNMIYDHREYAPCIQPYYEDTNNGIADIATHGENLFIKVKWRSLTYYQTESQTLKYSLGLFSKMIVLNDMLYVLRGKHQIDIYNIADLKHLDEEKSWVSYPPQLPAFTFSTIAENVTKMLTYRDDIWLVGLTVIYIYSKDGGLKDLIYWAEPIVDFCHMNGFLVSYADDVKHYV